MTKEEADTIIEKVKSDKSFSTRFQEESWGFSFRNGIFKYWSERFNEDGSETNVNEDWDEEKLRQFLIATYSFKTINERIK